MTDRLISVGEDFTLPAGVKITDANLPAASKAAAIAAKLDASQVAAAVAGKLDTSAVGAPGGVATLDTNSRVPDASLPTRLQDAALGVSFIRRGELLASVKDYGAKGDGVTDDTAAIQAAVNTIQAVGGGTLFFPPGMYYTASAVLICNNLTIRGNGATLIKTSASTSSVVFAGSSGDLQGYGAGPSNVTMHGLTFRGSFTAATKRTVCAMALHHSEDVLVYDCNFIEASGTGHRFDLQGCRNVTVRDCVFKGFDTSYGDLYTEDVQADFSTRGGASWPEPNPASYDTLPSRGITVENCKWYPLTVGGTVYPAGNPFGSHAGVVGQYTENLVFRGNYVENPVNDTTSNTPGTLHFMAPKNLLIENNVIVGNGNTCPAIKVYKALTGATTTSAQDGTANVTLTPPQVFDNVKIIGNTITGYTGGADCIRLDGDITNRASDATVENNKLLNNSPDLGATNTGPITVTITYVDAVTYRGNKVRGSRRVCFVSWCSNVMVAQNSGINIGANDIHVDNCTQVTIVGNVLTSTKYFGIYVNVCTDVSVTANSVEGHINDATAPLIRVSSPTRAVVANNVAKGLAGTSNKGIEMSGTLTSSLIANNIAIGFTSPILPAATTTGATVTGNITA